MLMSPWTVDSLKILTRSELAFVLDDLGRRAQRSASSRMNRLIFRLACCCGLRVSEIAALSVGDVAVSVSRPHLRIGPEGAKGKKARMVPIWWDAGTLADLTERRRERDEQGARPTDQCGDLLR